MASSPAGADGISPRKPESPHASRPFPARPPGASADPAGARAAAVGRPARRCLDQARRLHGPGRRRQQDAQAGVPARGGAGGGGRHPGDPGRDPVQPRAPDGGGRGGPWAGLRDHPRGPHRLHRGRLCGERQRPAGPAVRGRDPRRAGRLGHERRAGDHGRCGARPRRQPLCHSRRRLQSRRRARLCRLRPGDRHPGRRDGSADRPDHHRHRQRRHPCRSGGRAGGDGGGHPGAGHRRAGAEAEAGGECPQAGARDRRPAGPSRRGDAGDGGGRLRLCRRGLRLHRRQGDRGPDPCGAQRGAAAGSGLFGQGHEGADRPGRPGRSAPSWPWPNRPDPAAAPRCAPQGSGPRSPCRR